MELIKVVKKLEKLLQDPLPGRLGHLTMLPQPVDEKRFSVRDDHRKGAVLMLFYPDSNSSFVPFIKRPEYPGVHGGQISFPGGKWEPEDADLSVTALREAEEEIGVYAEKVTVLGKLSDVYIPPSNFLVSPFIGFVSEKPDFRPDATEVERIISCPFPLLIDKEIRKHTQVRGSSGVSFQAPFFDIENEVVWGATAMMLGEFTYLWENSKF
ncbi:CoA pyrophosphatase [Aquiflexum sp. TKW24L]|uniref:NUDIX hydrolase n=1 Tax=Aquiflexum sp. TKW24L TaxID=2942212 RepID=UPI0020BFA5CE|nr:CoA pyrophosphatase [Aquiflexum sp. TKW24L]MCL6260590.1 CoA pyrophosphatase [Aquiflexum sp. TKW24L]